MINLLQDHILLNINHSSLMYITMNLSVSMYDKRVALNHAGMAIEEHTRS